MSIEKVKINYANSITIVDYEPKYKQAFVDLNVEWISHYFKMEESDYKALTNPEDYILGKEGHILVALYNDEPVWVCALIPFPDADYDFELAKMAVSPKAQGKNIGYLLGTAVINKAKNAGATKIYLESNTILKPAIGLYRKLGFTEIPLRPTPYERCDIQMELLIR